jgi:hypothetical protein
MEAWYDIRLIRKAAARMHCRIINPIQDRRPGIPSMKPNTEKPIDAVMRFFTPELFVRYNSSDDEEADRADEDWESADQQYQSHLATIRPHLPSRVRKLADLCLHDAEVLSCERDVEPSSELPMIGAPPTPRLVIISVGREDTVVSLIYQLWETPRRREYEGRWPFSKRNPHWLYDEVDVAPSAEGRFLHRILFSDGLVLEIPFKSVFVHTIPMNATDDSVWSKQIA